MHLELHAIGGSVAQVHFATAPMADAMQSEKVATQEHVGKALGATMLMTGATRLVTIRSQPVAIQSRGRTSITAIMAPPVPDQAVVSTIISAVDEEVMPHV
mmetsp:Transcript_13793/g.25766  ORF Transcript_13793/g.25766 Transcript_13793/m.25766 type:complete len:101 (-) Transcript_13793:11-313(-)